MEAYQFMLHKILLVDNEAETISHLSLNLRVAGFEVIAASDGASGLAQAKDKMPSLIVLDLALPQIRGFEVCRQLKADISTRHIPIIILTAQDMELDRIVGFELGADDYVVKPFSVREMILRIRKSLERNADQPPPQKSRNMTFGELVLDPTEQEVTIQNKLVHLTPKQFKVLSLLMQQKGRTFGRETLLYKVWGQSNKADFRMMDVLVRRLRWKLGKLGCAIETIRGFGYRLNENIASSLKEEGRQRKLDYINYPLKRMEHGKTRFAGSKKSEAGLLALK